MSANRNGNKSCEQIATETMEGLDEAECLEAAQDMERIGQIIRERISGKLRGSENARISQPEIESVGNICSTNYWIKLGLMREELAALKEIGLLFKNSKDQTTGNALHLVVATALLHWEMLEPFVFSDKEYCEAEGFPLMEQYRRAVLGRKFPALKPDGRAAWAKKSKAEKSTGFFKVNMSRHEEAELRDLAHASGTDLRTVIRKAILSERLAMEDNLKIAKDNNLDLRELNRLTILCPPLNNRN
jgi:hypothetical protein